MTTDKGPIYLMVGVGLLALAMVALGLFSAANNAYTTIITPDATLEASNSDTLTLQSTPDAGQAAIGISGDASGDSINMSVSLASCPATGATVAVYYDPTTRQLTC